MYGLVLEGGGGKGAYHIGAVKALNELGIEIGAVAGVSVGALNGAMIVQGDIDRAYEIWYDINPAMVLNMDESLYSDSSGRSSSLNVTLAAIKKFILEKGLDIQPLVDLLKQNIDEEKIRKSPVDFGIVTFDLTERKPVEIYKENIPAGKLVDYIIASASFPAFKPAVIDGKKYLDGGFYNNLPVNLVQDKGFKDVIIVRTFAFGIRRHFDTAKLNLTSIEPAENLGPILDFTVDTARKTLKLGYYDTLKVMKGLKGRKYYIEPLNGDDFFIDYISSFSDEKIKSLCDMFGNEKFRGKRALFEYIIPKIADLLGLPKNATYEDIAIGLMENIAEACGLERFKIYSIRDLYKGISKSNKFEYDGFLKDTPGFLKNNDLFAKFAKNRILEGIAGEIFNNFKPTVR